MKGSRKGYHADIDALSACSGEDEVSATNATSTSSRRLRFYSHIRPRRREKNKSRNRTINRATHQPITSCIHPDIDLSLVSLISSKEFDSFGSSPAAAPSSPDIINDSTSDIRAGQVNDNIIKNEKKYNSLASSRPLAVIDYGSIKLDMSGSLLDSIYKIGGSGSGRSTDLLFGGRCFSLNDGSKSNMNNYDNKAVVKSQTRVDKPVGMAAALLEPAFTVASSRSSEVEAVIASLKNTPTAKRISMSCSLEGPEHKRQKIAKSPSTKRVDNFPTTLEDSISFSPFARVLFCAQAPYNIVHTNAAYSTLVQKGLAKPCIVGESFASNDRHEVENSDAHISRIVDEHIGALQLEDDRNSKENSDQSRKLLSGFVGLHHIRILPVVSIDETCSQTVRSYEKCHLQLRQMNSPHDNNIMEGIPTRSYGDAMPSSQDLSSTVDPNSCTQHISHYLLQIEPSAKLP